MLIFKLYGVLKPADFFPFLILILISAGSYLIPFTRKKIKLIPQPQDRASKVYNELLLVHNSYVRKLAIDHHWIFLVTSLSWAFFSFLCSWSLHPSVLVAVFFVAFLFVTRVLEKEGKKDREIIALTLKGVKAESQLPFLTHHTFSSFVKKRKGLFLFPYAFLRALAPLLSFAILVERIIHHFPSGWGSEVKLILIGVGGIILTGRMIKIYLPLGQKCKVRAYVLEKASS